MKNRFYIISAITLLFFTVLLYGCQKKIIASTVIEEGKHGGFHNILNCDSVKRTYTLYIPESCNKPATLLIALHGLGGDGKIMMDLTGFNDIADRKGFIVVYPDGLFRLWKSDGGTDEGKQSDVKFISELIDYLKDNLNINEECVYVTGISNGGLMCYRLATELSHKISGIAPVVAAMTTYQYDNFSPPYPIPVLIMNGTEDPLVPWEGGSLVLWGLELGKVMSAEEIVDFWIKNNNCSEKPVTEWLEDKDPDDGTKVKKDIYSGESNSKDVILYTIEGGGHSWPGTSVKFDEEKLGRTSKDINASEVIWEFFEKTCKQEDGKELTAVNKNELQYTVKNVTTIGEGGRVDWSHSLNIIAFDRKGEDGYYDIWTMNPDGTDQKCLTDNHPDLPNKHIGQPAWHPSGKYLVFQAEKKEHSFGKLGMMAPGAGFLNDLWIMDMDTGKAYLLWEIPNERDYGTLHPHFSEDGKKLSWTQMYDKGGIEKDRWFGYWKLKVADFVIDDNGIPKLENVKTYQPGAEAFYENHGFSPDGKYLIFSSPFEKGLPPLGNNNIYLMNLEDESIIQLTDESYNEHALFSPDGKKIVWMTTKDNPNKGADFWLMDSDGSNKQRLTHFNDPDSSYFENKIIMCADSSWSPEGERIIGYYWKSDDYIKYLAGEAKDFMVMIELEKRDSSGDSIKIK